MTTSMKKPLLAVLAVAAVAVVAVVIVENTPERRMDRKLDRLLRLYEDDPKQLYQRLDDRDLLGFVLVNSFLRYNGPRCSCDARTSSHYPGSLYSPPCTGSPCRRTSPPRRSGRASPRWRGRRRSSSRRETRSSSRWVFQRDRPLRMGSRLRRR